MTVIPRHAILPIIRGAGLKLVGSQFVERGYSRETINANSVKAFFPCFQSLFIGHSREFEDNAMEYIMLLHGNDCKPVTSHCPEIHPSQHAVHDHRAYCNTNEPFSKEYKFRISGTG